LTFTVGQLQSPGTPLLSRIYDDEDMAFYFVDLGNGDLTLHLDLKVKATLSIIKKVEEVFNFIVLGCIERGMNYIDTWVEDDAKQIRFAEFFGFEITGRLKIIQLTEGSIKKLHEMRYTFPELED
jgi:hypothetical protein